MNVRAYAEKQIKKYLKYPSTAKFSNVKAMLISEHSDYNEYKVTGEIAAQDTFGDLVKASFYIYLKCHPDGICHAGDWNIHG